MVLTDSSVLEEAGSSSVGWFWVGEQTLSKTGTRQEGPQYPFLSSKQTKAYSNVFLYDVHEVCTVRIHFQELLSPLYSIVSYVPKRIFLQLFSRNR